jgi:hypothetical protein
MRSAVQLVFVDYAIISNGRFQRLPHEIAGALPLANIQSVRKDDTLGAA